MDLLCESMDLLCEVLEPGKVTLVAPLSWEVGDGFLSCSGNFSRDIFARFSIRAEIETPLRLTRAR